MRTKQEIDAEIKALNALKPTGVHARATLSKIAYAIEELQFGVDQTAEEWSDMRASEQDIVNTTRAWKEGNSEHRPSEGWGSLVK